MIETPICLTYENCECVYIQPEAVGLINFTLDHSDVFYCPSAGETDLDVNTYLNKLRLHIDISNPQLLRDSLDGEDPVQVILKRRDITSIDVDGCTYHVNWYQPDYPAEYGYSPLLYTNAYQDPTKVDVSEDERSIAKISIDSTKPDPEYKMGLVCGQYIYIAEYEGSSTYTRRYKLKFPVRGSELVAIKYVYNSEIEGQSKICCYSIINDRIANSDHMCRKDITWLDNGFVNFGIEEDSGEIGFWKSSPFDPIAIEKAELDAVFPVFKHGKLIMSHTISCIKGLANEMQTEIDKNIIQAILHQVKQNEQ